MKYLVPALVIVIIIFAASLSFFLGRSGVGSQKSATSVAVNTPSRLPTSTAVPTEVSDKKRVTAGGILTFPRYELEIPSDWEESRETQGKDVEKVILKKGIYEISITQGGFGGAMCLYPGDADVDGPSAKYESFREIVTKSNDKLRRSWTGDENKSKGFGICQMTDYGWQAPTLYGHVSLITPTDSDPAIIAEMDGILTSLSKI